MNERNFKIMSDEELIKETCIRTPTCSDYILASIELNKRRKKKEYLMVWLTVAILVLTFIILYFTAAQFYNSGVVVSKPINVTEQPNYTPHNNCIGQKK